MRRALLLLAVLGCHHGDTKPGAVSLVLHRAWDHAAIGIDDDGAVRDPCGEFGHLDPATGVMTFVRVPYKPEDLHRHVGTRNRWVSTEMGTSEVRGGTLYEGKQAIGEITGYDDTDAALVSLAALVYAEQLGECGPKETLALAGGAHRLDAGGVGATVRDGGKVIATGMSRIQA